MDLSNLSPAPGAIRKRRRVGRGIAAGRGKTCGRGTKGAGARAGSKSYVGFEGGQMPLQRRVPKRGFHNKWRVEYTAVNLASIERLEGVEEVTPELLRAQRLVRGRNTRVKILGDGQLSRPVKIAAHAFSRSAKEKISAAGGSFEVLG